MVVFPEECWSWLGGKTVHVVKELNQDCEGQCQLGWLHPQRHVRVPRWLSVSSGGAGERGVHYAFTLVNIDLLLRERAVCGCVGGGQVREGVRGRVGR